ncbi:CPBP family intramembrane glutamic endopeptidase [Hyalangium rubrum]|uniref:Type II CAAX endopeptidase family protein n=1 Tax=Hyalangium rubrum TaxID=3103134 RepID=A0ABU5H4B4_9BACT|nr:type II CAAX endopeptidase family protein [Hyalangium sp. s54d21]MDY7228321.1 type II CAAX endopeptidase family protein [Hyalangium sp. s54d21]
MDRSKIFYPSISQAAGLMLVFIAFAIVVALPFESFAALLPAPLNTNPLIQSALGLVGYGLAVGLTIRRGLRNKSLLDGERPALRFTRVPAGILAMACILTVFMGFILTVLIGLLPTPGWYEQVMDEALRPNVFSFASVVLLAPLLEEVLFRGLILEGLLKNYRPSTAIAVSALLFGVVHLNPWQGIAGALMGIFLGWLYWKTRSLLPCILVHATSNLLCYLVGTSSSNTTSNMAANLLSGPPLIALFFGSAAVFAGGWWWLGKSVRRHVAA